MYTHAELDNDGSMLSVQGTTLSGSSFDQLLDGKELNDMVNNI